MNPFELHKIIRKSKENGERLIIEELSNRCGVRIRHAHVRMSKEMFECEACGGFPRHWVKGLRPSSYLSLWFYKPPKQTDFSPGSNNASLKKYKELKNLNDVDKDNIQDELEQNISRNDK